MGFMGFIGLLIPAIKGFMLARYGLAADGLGIEVKGAMFAGNHNFASEKNAW